MQSTRVMTYLRGLCRDMDEGRPLQRFEWRRAIGTLAIPVVIGLASFSSGCAQEDCRDGADNDGDHKVDCSDPDCYDACGANAEYAAPFPDRIEPPFAAEYAAPFPDDIAPMPDEAYASPFWEPNEQPKPEVNDEPDPGLSVPAYGVPPVENPSDSAQPLPQPSQRYRAPFPDNVRRYGAPMPRW